MLVIPGQPGNDLCDPLPRMSRRDLLRVGGLSLAGLSLANVLRAAENNAPVPKGNEGRGFGKAKSVILVYLQGGPSHLDLWTPRRTSRTR